MQKHNIYNCKTHNAPQSGSVIFYVFLAIALMAGLAFAVSQNSRSASSGLGDDRIRLLATETIGFADTVSKAVTQLRLRGIAVNAISFANPFLSEAQYGVYNARPANEVFNPSGGAVVYQAPQDGVTIAPNAEYLFLAGNEIENIGRTCGAAQCSDVIMVLSGLRLDICTQINDLLGVPNPSGVPPMDTNIDLDDVFLAAVDPFSYNFTIGDEAAALSGVAEACFTETTSNPDIHTYYKVLMPR
jgi:hypothetical protein